MTRNERLWRDQFIFGHLADVRKDKNPMERQCTCAMEHVSARNDLHDSHCDLWSEPTFRDGSDEWDGDLGCLVLNRSPWEHAEDFVWNGDTPVVAQTTAAMRAVQQERAHFEQTLLGDVVDVLNYHEEEIQKAIVAGCEPDEHGFMQLPDGSYADTESRVTYRRVLDAEGNVCWQDEDWDEEGWDTDLVIECMCQPQKRFYCHTCNVKRHNETDEWMEWAAEDYNRYASTSGPGAVSYTYNTCGHTFETFDLPGMQNENIKISGQRLHTETTTPDHGYYASNCWNPKSVATFIPWADYGLPTCSFEHAAETIVDLWDKSNAGKVVEVGCMGGHGRTGTILACIAILSDDGMSPSQAVAWVRSVHCKKAVESDSQEWFVAWFAAWHRGTECPPRPVVKQYVDQSKTDPNWKAAQTAGSSSSPKALPSGGQATNLPGGGTFVPSGTPNVSGKWCSSCTRIVHVSHNTDCLFAEVDAQVLKFDAALYDNKTPAHGETANARRRNARRANKKNARKENALDSHS